MDDFKILKSIVEGKVNIDELDTETKRNLIKICEDRLKVVERKIEEKNEQINVMLKKINNNK